MTQGRNSHRYHSLACKTKTCPGTVIRYKPLCNASHLVSIRCDCCGYSSSSLVHHRLRLPFYTHPAACSNFAELLGCVIGIREDGPDVMARPSDCSRGTSSHSNRKVESYFWPTECVITFHNPAPQDLSLVIYQICRISLAPPFRLRSPKQDCSAHLSRRFPSLVRTGMYCNAAIHARLMHDLLHVMHA